MLDATSRRGVEDGSGTGEPVVKEEAWNIFANSDAGMVPPRVLLNRSTEIVALFDGKTQSGSTVSVL